MNGYRLLKACLEGLNRKMALQSFLFDSIQIDKGNVDFSETYDLILKIVDKILEPTSSKPEIPVMIIKPSQNSTHSKPLKLDLVSALSNIT